MKSERKDKYRFDDAYRRVYKYNSGANAYIHLCSYLQADIKSNMRESTKTARADDYDARY